MAQTADGRGADEERRNALSAFYNENDPKTAAWLRELIGAGLIAPGIVDERSITEIQPHELDGFTQCHFFAGIGGWSYALRLAGISDDEPIWTGSCPCQPFSQAGLGKVDEDERHLWPAFRELIAKREPAICFGEQVASADGRIWLAGIRADLEALGYGVGAADLCAASVGSPQPRQRLYWLGYRKGERCGKTWSDRGRPAQRFANAGVPAPRMVNPAGAGLQREWSEYRASGERCSGLVGFAVQIGVPEWNGPTVAVQCSDGPRRISAKPDSFPLAHGVFARMVKLRGSGNAIVPQVAAEFIAASLEAIADCKSEP